MHDPRLGKFFAVDPLASKYPHNSPYAFSENRVIDGVELEGLEFLDYKDSKILSMGPHIVVNWKNINIFTRNSRSAPIYGYDSKGNVDVSKYYGVQRNIQLFDYKFIKSSTPLTGDIGEQIPSQESIDNRPIKKDGTRDKRYSTRENNGGGLNQAKAMRGVKAVVVVEILHGVKDAGIFYDEGIIKEQNDLMLTKVLPALQDALNSGNTYIPEHLRGSKSLGLIANVILFGGDGSSEYTDEIITAGIEIYKNLTEKGIKENEKNKSVKMRREDSPEFNSVKIDNTAVKTRVKKGT